MTTNVRKMRELCAQEEKYEILLNAFISDSVSINEALTSMFDLLTKYSMIDDRDSLWMTHDLTENLYKAKNLLDKTIKYLSDNIKRYDEGDD